MMKTFWILSAILLLHAACLQGISPPHNPPSPNTKPSSPPDSVKPVYFPNLKTTFTTDTSKRFKDEPRNRSEAERAGFKLIGSGCKEGKDKYPYPGDHLIQRFDNETGRGGEIILIYDGQGKIAGISSVTEIKSPQDPNPNLFKHPTFQKVPGLNGKENYVSIAYFVPPSSVCHGRSEEEFEKQGTGTGLYIVNGPTVNHTITIPLYEPDDEPYEPKIIYRGGCSIYMGTRYFLHNPTDPKSVQSDCGDAPAIQILYQAQTHQLNGFAFRTPVSPPGKRWERFGYFLFRYLFGRIYPECYDDLARNGSKSIHVYFGPYSQLC